MLLPLRPGRAVLSCPVLSCHITSLPGPGSPGCPFLVPAGQGAPFLRLAAQGAPFLRVAGQGATVDPRLPSRHRALASQAPPPLAGGGMSPHATLPRLPHEPSGKGSPFMDNREAADLVGDHTLSFFGGH